VRSGKPRGGCAEGAPSVSVNENAPIGSFYAAAGGLAKSQAIGEEASSGSALTIIKCVWAVASRFSSLFLPEMKKDVQKARFEAAAAALRENLKRRKAQIRGRAENESGTERDPSTAPTGPEKAIAPRNTP
jgi:hypothetical protein